MAELLSFVPLPPSPSPISSKVGQRNFSYFVSRSGLKLRGSPSLSQPLVLTHFEEHTKVRAGTLRCFYASLSSTSSDNRVSFTRHQFLRLITAVSLTPALLLLPKEIAIASDVSSAYELSPLKNGKPYPLSGLRGKVTLFVNVASYCALTPQYKGLVLLHDKYQSQGFEVIAAPCNQFARQEPGTDEDICSNVRRKFGARFLLLDKLAVNETPNEGQVAPLYRFLRNSSPERRGGPILWNFEKFLVGPSGNVLRRYSPGIFPEGVEADIQFALTQPGEPLPPKPKPYLGVS